MPISGLVTVDGSDIESGTIGFFPTRGTSGPSTTSLIRVGRFQFTTENGPYAGAYRAEITIDQIDPNGQERNKQVQSGSSVSSGQSASDNALVDPKKRMTNQSKAAARKNARKNAGESKRKWNVDCVVPADGPMELNFDL